MIITVNFPVEAIEKKRPKKIGASMVFNSTGFEPVPDLRDTGAMLYQLSYEATHWERGQLNWFISPREE